MSSNKLSKISDYDKKIQKEADFWAHKCGRPRGNIPVPYFLWEDPDSENILRGKYKQFIIDTASSKPGNRVLELGCGQGWLSLEVAQHGIQVDAFDLSPSLIEFAKNNAKQFTNQAGFRTPNFQVQDLNIITLAPETYDVVMIWDALHHIVEAERLLGEIWKSLKPGGSLVMIDHIHGPLGPGLTFAECIRFFFPMDITYSQRLTNINKKLHGKYPGKVFPKLAPDKPQEESPFEDVTRKEMVVYIQKHFNIRKKKYLLSFAHHFCAILRIHPRLRRNMIRGLKILDDLLIALHLLPGDYIFIWAVKE